MTRLQVGRAVTPSGVIEGATIEMTDERIVAITPGELREGLWAVPGFVDTHCHGAVGVSFGDPDRAANRKAIAYHRSQGTTTLFASTVTEPVDKLESQVRVLRELVEAGELDGIHLEGPFLAEERRGAHDPALLRDPEPEFVERLIAVAGPALKMITLAVERRHAKQATRRFIEAGVKVAFGHSDADDAKTAESLDWGADIATHLFSAMRPIHHREPGPVPVLLSDDRVMCELICDGIHHRPVIARMAIDAAGVDRIALVTDAMSATGQGDGRYVLGELAVAVHDGTARLITPDGSTGSIAGSTLTMAKAFEFVVGEVGLSIPEAARVAATTPARWHQLAEVGTLEVGKLADICLVDDGGRLRHVWRRGRQLR
ncbi:MAG: N-acetylglucosamine-6-phosphate deacetylase [Propionibacteriaceae bacterium]|nr:N-acetylglucosamine-6-phosphate deacetylase [Propionibacteriaceae bacterium]